MSGIMKCMMKMYVMISCTVSLPRLVSYGAIW